MKQANPQGKGLVPVLDDWAALQPCAPQDKSRQHIFSDYVTSSLVLSAEFNFRPVVGTRYHLYYRQSANTIRWRLSLIEPERMLDDRLGEYFACVSLNRDMTWSLHSVSDRYDDQVVNRFLQDFAAHCAQFDTLADSLPVFAEQLPFYRRMAASALAKSLRLSMTRAGLEGLQTRQWLDAPDTDLALPGRRN